MSFSKGIGYGSQGATAGMAVGGPLGAAIGGAAGLLGGLFSDDGTDEALASIDKGIAAIEALQIPDIDKALLIQQYQQNGTLSPELVEQLNLNADQKQVLTESPETLARQQYAMNALKQMSQTGMSAQDLAQAQAMRSDVAEDTGAKTAQLLQQSQMRGQLGAGDTLAAQLMAAQEGGQRASKDAINTAAAAAQARQQALSQYGSMAGQVRGQDYATQQANMQNELERQRFLDQNSIGRQAANVAAKNQANMYNLQRQQGVGDMNVSSSVRELERQQQARAQKSALEMQRAGMLATAQSNRANIQSGNAANAAQADANMWSGLSGFATAGAEGGLFGDDAQKRMFAINESKAPKIQKKAHGGEIEGPEVVSHDSEENDIVPVLASAGEFVIPKSKMKDAESAKSFIDKHFKVKKEPSKHEHLLDLIAELHGRKSKE